MSADAPKAIVTIRDGAFEIAAPDWVSAAKDLLLSPATAQNLGAMAGCVPHLISELESLRTEVKELRKHQICYHNVCRNGRCVACGVRP